MKQLFLFILLVLTFSAKGQGFSWAQAINGSSTSVKGTGVYAGATDNSRNLYSVGWFTGTADFDAGPGVFDLTAVSNADMFIMKQDPSGNLIWVKQVEGLSSRVRGCFGRSIDVDQSGNLFITGYLSDSFDFDPGPATYKLMAGEGEDGFILKLDSSGNFLWVGSIGSQAIVYPADIRIVAAKRDKDGNLYFGASIYAGSVGATIDVDPSSGVHTVHLGNGELLLGKVDSNGSLYWADLIGGATNPGCSRAITSLAVDSNSNVFMSGNSSCDFDIDPGPAVYRLIGDIFISKFDPAGQFVWAKGFSDYPSSANLSGSAVDRLGGIIVTGSFSGTVDFDPGAGVYNVTAKSAKNVYTLRLRNSSEFSWVKTAGESFGTYYGRGVATDSGGNVYTVLQMDSSCDLDPGGGSYYVGSGVAVQELDRDGNFVWGAGWQANVANWIGVDKSDSVYVSGVFSGENKDFDPGPGAFLLSGSDNGSGFIIKLKQTPVPTGIKETGMRSDIRVYPNPSSGVVSFSSQSVIRRIEVTDLAGKRVYANEPKGTETSIDLGGKVRGIYFYEVDCVAGKQRGKLLIN